MNFLNLKKSVQDRFNQLQQENQLFIVEVDREKIWELYLNGFETEEERQHHNCNCCKSFLRQWSGIVAIRDNKIETMWDLNEVEDGYKNSIDNIRSYIRSLPVVDIFVNDFPKLGTDRSVVRSENGDIVWNHFFVQLENRFLTRAYTRGSSIEGVQGNYRTTKEILNRGLLEFNKDTISTVLELIAQGSLYRGNEFKSQVDQFLALRTEFESIPAGLRENWCWVKVGQIPEPLARLRNTAIGTLLINIAEGMDLDTAVGKWEAVMAPANYKRPKAIVTPKMVEEAKKTIEELGYSDSLERRTVTQTDLPIEEIIYTDRSTSVKDIFQQIAEEGLVNPRQFNKVEEIRIEDFTKNVVPIANKIEVLLENSHLNKFVALTTAVNQGAPTMFKWPNSFGWSYTGGTTDTMKENVKAAGGNVEGVLRFSIQWNENGKDIVDLDAHAYEPGGQHINYSAGFRRDSGNAFTCMTGQLDVDMIRPAQTGIENIYWRDLSRMSEGTYRFVIHNYDGRRVDGGFRAQIEFDGQTFDFNYPHHFTGYMDVAEVTYSRTSGFTLKSNLQGTSNITTKEKWGLTTNHFIKVKTILLSPNHWQASVGNKHYLFMLEKCVSDEQPRPFYNEFLTEELMKNKRVFEVLAGKLEVQRTPGEIAGIGFSDTQKNSIFVRVEGKIKRILKINF